MNHFPSHKYTRNYLSKWKISRSPASVFRLSFPGKSRCDLREPSARYYIYLFVIRGRVGERSRVSRVWRAHKNEAINWPHHPAHPFSEPTYIFFLSLFLSIPLAYAPPVFFQYWSLLLKGSSLIRRRHVLHAWLSARKDFFPRRENRLVSRTVLPTASRARRFILPRRPSLVAKALLEYITRKRFVLMYSHHETRDTGHPHNRVIVRCSLTVSYIIILQPTTAELKKRNRCETL